MDKSLKLLKTYLDGRVSAYEKLTGMALGDNVLELRMVVNSDPGLIRLFVGKGTPNEDRSRMIDVWYDGTAFYEKNLTGWSKFEKYNEEFTTTILDAFSEEFPVDVPIAIEIDGPTFIDRELNDSAHYRVFMTLESGRRLYLDEAEIYIFDRSGKATLEVDASGVGTLDISKVVNTTNMVVKARFKLGDFAVLNAELPIQVFLAGTTFNEIHKIHITGPLELKVGQSGTYTAILTTQYLDTGEIESQDVTDAVTWSSNTLGTFTNSAFSPLADGSFERNVEILATLTKALGNGSTFDIIGTLDIKVIKMTISNVEVLGPDAVKENHSVLYTTKIVYRNGEIDTVLVPVWGILDAAVGTISQDGEFNAPMVAADIPQTITASVVFEGETFRGEKPIMVLDVLAPELSIIGPATMYDNEFANFFAQISFENETVDVSPDWQIVNASHGYFSAITNGKFTSSPQDINANARIRATINYRGYDVVGEAPLLIYTRKLTPVSITINGSVAVKERTSTTFVAMALMSDGTELDVTQYGRWSIDNTAHPISAAGVLTANSVNSNTRVTLSFEFSRNGVTAVATKNVDIEYDPIIWTPISLAINGPKTIDELSSHKYQADLTVRGSNGVVQVLTDVQATWLIQGYGTVDFIGNVTADEVGLTRTTTLTAVYNDGKNTPITASYNITITNVPLLKSLEILPEETVIFGGKRTNFVVNLLKRDESVVEVTSLSNCTYSFSIPNILSVDKSGKTINAGAVGDDVAVVVTATYVEAGETISASVTMDVRVSVGALVINPPSLDLFEGESTTLSASLTLGNGRSIPVNATFEVDPLLGTIDASGNFVAAQVTEEVNGLISARYSGSETNDEEIISESITVRIRNVQPELLELYNDGNVYTADEGGSIYLKTRIHWNSGDVVNNDPQVTFSLRPDDAQYLELIPNSATGILQVFVKDITGNVQVPVTAKYVSEGVEVEATRLISLRNIVKSVGLNLTVADGPYYKNGMFSVGVVEQFDDGSTVPVTSGIVWDYNSAMVSIVNGVLTVLADSGTFTVRAVKNNVSSNVFTGTVAANLPVSLEVYSTEGDKISRNKQTVLSASIKLSNGSFTSPNSNYPIVWTWESNTLLNVTENQDYTITVTALGTLDSGAVKFVATSGTVSAEYTINVEGFAVPTGATIRGAASVESGKTSQYELVVTYSDNTQKVYNQLSNDTAEFELDFTDSKFTVPGSITNRGLFTAPHHAETTQVLGYIHAAVYSTEIDDYVTAVPFEVAITPAVAVVPVSAEISAPANMSSGSTHQFSMLVLMSDNTTILINATSQEVAEWSANRGTISVKGLYTADQDPVGYSAKIVGTFTKNGVTVVAESKDIPVAPQTATALIISPLNPNVFEGSAVQFVARTNTGVLVTPAWSLANQNYGSIDANGLFTADTVTKDSSVLVTATYSGIETNSSPISGSTTINVKNLAPTVVEIKALTGGLTIDEGTSKEFKAEVLMTNGTKFFATDNVVFEIRGSAPAGVSLSYDPATGICTITNSNVVVTTSITVRATYTNPNGGEKEYGDAQIQLVDKIQRVVDLIVSTADGKSAYFEGSTVQLVVKQKFDNNSLSNPITSGVTWTVNNTAFGSIDASNIATLAAVTGDKQFIVTPTFDGVTASAPLTINIKDIVPLSVAVTSSKGTTIKRGETTELTATITYNNNTTGVATGTQHKVSWSNDNTAAGTGITVGGKYVFTASATDVDLSANIKATTDVSQVSGSLKLNIDGYPMPTSITINGLTEVNAGIAATYTSTVFYSDGSTKQVNASSVPKATWSTTLDLSTSGSFNAASGVLVPGETWSDRLGAINVEYTDAVSGVKVTGSKDVKILAKVVEPDSIIVSGPKTITAGQTVEYTAEVTLNNGTKVNLGSTNLQDVGTWTTTLTGVTLTNGKLVADSNIGNQSGKEVSVSYTKNNKTVSGKVSSIVATGAVTTTTPPPGTWEDAVYVGGIPHTHGLYLEANDATSVQRMTTLIIRDNASGTGKIMKKIANNTNKFADLLTDMHYWKDDVGDVARTAGTFVTERICVMYPAKYGKAVFKQFTSGNWYDYTFTDGIDKSAAPRLIKAKDSSNADINPAGEPTIVTLPINGVPTDFYLYFAGSSQPPNSSNTKVTWRIKSE